MQTHVPGGGVSMSPAPALFPVSRVQSLFSTSAVQYGNKLLKGGVWIRITWPRPGWGPHISTMPPHPTQMGPRGGSCPGAYNLLVLVCSPLLPSTGAHKVRGTKPRRFSLQEVCWSFL